MNALKVVNDVDNKRLLTELEGAAYAGIGRTTFRAWAKEINARVNFGRTVRYDKAVIDKALDAMTAAAES